MLGMRNGNQGSTEGSTQALQVRALLGECERTVVDMGLLTTGNWPGSALLARVVIPMGLMFKGAIAAGLTFYGWMAASLALLVLQTTVVRFKLLDQPALETAVLYVFVVLTLALALGTPSLIAQPGYSNRMLGRVVSFAMAHLPHRSDDLRFVLQCIERIEGQLKNRMSVLRWTAGALFAVAAYFAQKGIERGDGVILGSSSYPLIVSGLIIGVLIAFERGAGYSFNLAREVLHVLQKSRVADEDRRFRRRDRQQRLRSDAARLRSRRPNHSDF